MNKLSGYLVIFALALTGCGGGTPYEGLWQCASDSDQSLEIKRFEDYFIINVREGDLRSKRDGIFENDAFTVGANNVGQPMALELNGEDLSCTNPPNFCNCDGPYNKVAALAYASNATDSQRATDTVAPTVVEAAPARVGQLILEREPIILTLRNGGTIRFFHDAANEETEKRSIHWSKLKYYYLPHLTLTELADGKFAEVRQHGDDVYVFFRLTTSKIDRFELMESIHASTSTTQILPELIVPLSYERISVEVPGSSLVAAAVIPSSDFDLESGPLDISLSISLEPGDDVAAKLKAGDEVASAVNNGTALPVALIEFVQMMNAENANAGDEENVTEEWPIAGPSKNP